MQSPRSDQPLANPPPDRALAAGRRRFFKGLLLATAGLFLFACMDAATKYLTAHYNVPFVVAMRYLIHCSVMLLILLPHQSRKPFKTQRTGLVVVRALALLCASLSLGLALQRMPLAETSAINFLAPILVVLLAGLLLGETVGLLGWLAVVAGFIGVLLIARPGSGLDTVGVVLALCAAASNATYQLLSRLLASSEKSIALLFYTALAGSLVFGGALPWYWENRVPSQLELGLFLVVGLAGGVGHYLFTAAYRYAPASLLAPVTYLQLLWAGLLGWLVFGQRPDAVALLGMGIVAAAGLLMAAKSRWMARDNPQPPPRRLS